MKLFVSIVLSLGLTAAVAQAAEPTKRKLAQQKVECVPLGVPFDIFNAGDSSTYTAEELKMLRNSIYAQVGFKFQSSKVTNEMTRRGCLKTDVKYTSSSLQKVDKENIRLLKSLEKALKDDAKAADFQGPWDKTAKSPVSRAKLLMANYCFISDANDRYFGILFFNSDKQNEQYQLNGMMNLAKPSWAEPMTEDERAGYINSIKYKQLDTTSAAVIDFATKGTWAVSDAGDVQISIKGDAKTYKNAAVQISSANYATNGMLDCKLAK